MTPGRILAACLLVVASAAAFLWRQTTADAQWERACVAQRGTWRNHDHFTLKPSDAGMMDTVWVAGCDLPPAAP